MTVLLDKQEILYRRSVQKKALLLNIGYYILKNKIVK